MQWFNNRSIRTKIMLNLVLVIIFAIIVGVMGFVNIRTIVSNDEELYQNITIPLAQLGQIAETFNRLRVNVHKILLVSDAELPGLQQNIKQLIDEQDSLARKFETTILSDELMTLFKNYIDQQEMYDKFSDSLIKLSLNSRRDEALKIVNGVGTELGLKVNHSIDALNEMKLNHGEVRFNENVSAGNSALWQMAGILLFGGIIALLLGMFSSNKISQPIIYLEKTLIEVFKMGKVDLTKEIKVFYHDEVGKLTSNLSDFFSSLRQDIAQIYNSSGEFSNASSQISAGAQSSSQTAQEQASAVEEISASIQEMSTRVKESADGIGDVDVELRRTQEISGKGMEVVTSTRESMSKINESNSAVAEIVNMVNEIAFQTNLLALNAAVEAARAGDAGKGFAVVASEVRSLAQRSAESANRIKELIGESTERIKNGNELVKSTTDIFEQIKRSINDMGTRLSSVKENVVNNASLMREITASVDNINDAVQQNASQAEELASTSEEMTSQAQQLLEIVNKFVVDEKSAHSQSIRKNSSPAATQRKNKPAFQKTGSYTNKPPKTGLQLKKPAVKDDFFDGDEFEEF